MLKNKKKLLVRLRAALRLRRQIRGQPEPDDSHALPSSTVAPVPPLAHAPPALPGTTPPRLTSSRAAAPPPPRTSASQPSLNSPASGQQTLQPHAEAEPAPAPSPAPARPARPWRLTTTPPAAEGSFSPREGGSRHAAPAGRPETLPPRPPSAPVASSSERDPSPTLRAQRADLNPQPCTPAAPAASSDRPSTPRASGPAPPPGESVQALAALLERQASALAAAARALARQDQALVTQQALLLAIAANQQRLRRELDAHARRLDAWTRSALNP